MKISYEKLTNLNSPHPYSEDFSVEVYKERITNVKYSFVIPVFNKGKQIESILNRLHSVAPSLSEFIIVNDASEDDTYSATRSWAVSTNADCKIVNCTVPFFETACDNIGFSLARGELICEFQSDLQINDTSFFSRAELAFQKFNIVSLSGRCGHSWTNLLSRRELIQYMMRQKRFYLRGDLFQVGKVTSEIYKDDVIGDSGGIYFSDTNNRGPWIVKRKMLGSKLLDSDNFFLGNDDHHFNLMHSDENFRPAYLPCRVFCLPQDGSTRQIRGGLNQMVFSWLKNNKLGRKQLIDEIMLREPKLVDFRDLAFSND